MPYPSTNIQKALNFLVSILWVLKFLGSGKCNIQYGNRTVTFEFTGFKKQKQNSQFTCNNCEIWIYSMEANTKLTIWHAWMLNLLSVANTILKMKNEFTGCMTQIQIHNMIICHILFCIGFYSIHVHSKLTSLLFINSSKILLKLFSFMLTIIY